MKGGAASPTVRGWGSVKPWDRNSTHRTSLSALQSLRQTPIKSLKGAHRGGHFAYLHEFLSTVQILASFLSTFKSISYLFWYRWFYFPESFFKMLLTNLEFTCGTNAQKYTSGYSMLATCDSNLVFFERLPRIQEEHRGPHWWGSVGWAPSRKPKDPQFNSLSGHTPGLWARSPGGRCERGNQSKFLLHIGVSLPPFFPPFLSKNK